MSARAVIAGGGIGGVEAALALRAVLGRRATITLLAAEAGLVYRSWSVGEPFGRGRTVTVDLAQLASERGIDLAVERLETIDVPGRTAVTDRGEHAYDHLILALGARPVEVVPGALTFRGPADSAALSALLAPGALPVGGAVAFVATAASTWTLPAYELALLTADRARRNGSGATVMLITAEARALEAFGPETSADVARVLAEQGVELVTSTTPDHFDGARLVVPAGGTLELDRVVALPGLLGRPVPGVPHDAGGFVPVDDFCRVEGLDGVYAVGDMTARPLKQGGLAAQQADVAAGAIAAELGEPIRPGPYVPVLRAMLLTADGPRYLRHPRAPGSTSGNCAPWRPPHKVSALHLSAYLAAHGELVSVA